MLDNVVICKKLGILIGYYKELQQLTDGLTIDTYLKNIMLKRAVEREMQLIVESATDINNMILKKQGESPSRDYYNSFIDLAENKVIDMDFALEIAPSTGLRNILVHEYQKIDDIIVFKSINNVLNQYLKYIETISRYLGCTE
jgi:uncharacterized protein YutE (UPF0331/DUF86 family)